MVSPYTFWTRFDSVRRVSIREVSEKAGVRYDRLLHNRSDCRLPSLEDLVRLCEFLDVSPLYLLLDDNDEASRASTVQEAFIKASESQKEAVEAILGLTGQGHK